MGKTEDEGQADWITTWPTFQLCLETMRLDRTHSFVFPKAKMNPNTKDKPTKKISTELEESAYVSELHPTVLEYSARTIM